MLTQTPSHFLPQTILRALLSTTAPFCILSLRASLAQHLENKDTEGVEPVASGGFCHNHVLNFVCVRVPQCQLSLCPLRGTSCETLSRSMALQRL